MKADEQRPTTKQLDQFFADAAPDWDPEILRAIDLIEHFRSADPGKTSRVRRLAREALYQVVTDYRKAIPAWQRLDRALNFSTDPSGEFTEALRKDWWALHDKRQQDRQDWIDAGRPGPGAPIDPLMRQYLGELKIAATLNELSRRNPRPKRVATVNGVQLLAAVLLPWRSKLPGRLADKVSSFLAAREGAVAARLETRLARRSESEPLPLHQVSHDSRNDDELCVIDDGHGAMHVRVRSGYNAQRADEVKRHIGRYRPHLEAWDATLRLIARKAGVPLGFKTGLLFCDEDKGLTVSDARGRVVYLQPEFLDAAMLADPDPHTIASYLKVAADHEISHFALMGRGHDTEWVAAREELGAITGGLTPQIVKIAEGLSRRVKALPGGTSSRCVSIECYPRCGASCRGRCPPAPGNKHANRSGQSQGMPRRVSFLSPSLLVEAAAAAEALPAKPGCGCKH